MFFADSSQVCEGISFAKDNSNNDMSKLHIAHELNMFIPKNDKYFNG